MLYSLSNPSLAPLELPRTHATSRWTCTIPLNPSIWHFLHHFLSSLRSLAAWTLRSLLWIDFSELNAVKSMGLQTLTKLHLICPAISTSAVSTCQHFVFNVFSIHMTQTSCFCISQLYSKSFSYTLYIEQKIKKMSHIWDTGWYRALPVLHAWA